MNPHGLVPPAIALKSFLDPRQIFGSSLVEWWSANSGVCTDLGGTTPVVNDGDLCNSWKGIVGGGLLVAGALNQADPWKKNRIGPRPAVAFGGTNQGVNGAALSHTFSKGVTLIVLGQFQASSLAFRSVMSIGPDGASDPTGSANGFIIKVGSATTTLEIGRNNVTSDWATAFSTGVPYMIVARLKLDVPAPVDIAGVTTNPGIQQLFVNGGYPKVAGFHSAVSAMTTANASLGCRADSTFGAKVDIAEAFVIDGGVPPSLLQVLRDKWILPVYGTSVF